MAETLAPPARRGMRPARLFTFFALAPLGYLLLCAAAFGPWVLPLVRYLGPPQRLTVPVEGLVPPGLSSTWGAPRPEGRRHQGADLFAARGTPVVASAKGVVWKVGLDRLGGRVVTVLGEGPAFYYYAHLDDWAEGLQRGREVQRGELLGYVGNSGNARTTPPHLHFGIYRIGLTGIQAIDPVPLLKRTQDPFGN